MSKTLRNTIILFGINTVARIVWNLKGYDSSKFKPLTRSKLIKLGEEFVSKFVGNKLN